MLRYKIALINVWWHQGDENQPYFESVTAQTAYFNQLTANGAYFTPLVNFNMFDNVRTMITYRDESGRIPEQLVASNYAVVQWINPETSQTYYRYYYATCSQDSGVQMRVELILDDIQTNYFRFKSSFQDVFIRRAFINRYVAVGSSYYLNFWDERFWIDEDLPALAQYCYDATGENIIPLTPWGDYVDINTTNKNAVYQFYKDYIIGWQVLFVARNAQLKIGNNITITPGTFDYQIDHWRRDLFPTGTQESPLRAPFGIIAAPIYRRASIPDGSDPSKMPIIILQTSDGTQVRLVNRIDQILSNPDNSPFIYSYQITQHNFLLPYLRNGSGAVAEQTNERQLIISCNLTNSKFVPIPTTTGGVNFPNEEDMTEAQIVDSSNRYALITGYTQPRKELLIGEVTPDMLGSNSYTKAMLKSTEYKYNPKLYASQFQCLKLEYYNGESFTIDILRLGKRENNASASVDQKLLFDWTEPLSTIINQAVITYYSSDDAISYFSNYMDSINKYFRDLSTISDFGLICTMDLSLMYFTNNYSEYIANNKNYYTQRSYNLNTEAKQWAISQASNVVGSIAGGASQGGAVGALAGGAGGLLNAGVSAASLALKQEQTLKNSEWDLDNMRGAPNTLKGNSCDVLGAAMRKRFGMRLTHWTISERFLKRFNIFLNKYAYKLEEELGTLDPVETMTTYDHNRKYWNYLECTVGTIPHSSNPLNGITYLSNQEEAGLKQALERGVRFWNNPQVVNGESISPVNFNQQNYELALDEE